MTADEFKKLDLLERLKIQTICIDIATANSLYEHAKEFKETDLFLKAFAGALSTERTSKEKNIYTTYFNALNAKAYFKQVSQSMGGKKSKRTKSKTKLNGTETELLQPLTKE